MVGDRLGAGAFPQAPRRGPPALCGLREGRSERGTSRRGSPGRSDPRLLGHERLTERVLAKAGPVKRLVVTPEELVEQVAGADGIEPLVLSARGRQRRPPEARAATLSEVARRFDGDVVTLRKGLPRVRLRARSSPAFRERFDGLGVGVATEKP